MKKFFIFFLLFFYAVKISAQECPPETICSGVSECRGFGGRCISSCELGCCCKLPAPPSLVQKLIDDIINFILDIALAAAGIIIIIGGYFMITSAGDPQKFEKGKKALLYGAVGLILILIAQALAEELIKLVSG